MSKLPLNITLLCTAALCSLPAFALDADGIAIHGSVSLSDSSSDTYNFYGDTADGKFDLNVREVTLNGAYRFADGVSVSAQVYSYDIDGFSQTVLDFASVDYSFKPWFGIRLGRNKNQTGLYGDVQDLDQTRTFASLPFGLYPKTLRPFAYSDGANIYGNIGLGKSAGSLDYSIYAGRLSNVPSDAPISRAQEGITTVDTIQIPLAYGAYLMWNTPVDGLRVGYSAQEVPRIDLLAHLSTEAVATLPGFNYSATPLFIDATYGAGAWDAAFAGSPANTMDYLFNQFLSAEYTWQNWVFAAELKSEISHSSTNIAALGVAGQYGDSDEIDSYVMATYQATKKIGLGLYYGYSNNNRWDHTTPSYINDTRDAAGVISYAISSNWLVKAEFHEINGLGLIDSAGDQNPNALTASHQWTYLILKTTFSF